MNIISYYKLSNEEMKQFNQQLESDSSSNYEADEYILEFLKELRSINRSKMMDRSDQQVKQQHHHYKQYPLTQKEKIQQPIRIAQFQPPTYLRQAPREYQRKYDKLIEPDNVPKAKTPTYDISEIERKIDTLISEQQQLTSGLKLNNPADKGISFKNYHESNKLMYGATSTEYTKTKKRDLFCKNLKKVFHFKKR